MKSSVRMCNVRVLQLSAQGPVGSRKIGNHAGDQGLEVEAQ